MNSIATNSCHSAFGRSGIRRSFGLAARAQAVPDRENRPLRYGDRIHVQLVRVQPGQRVIADFILAEVNDLSEVYGELRHYTRGLSGLSTLYVRNLTRGWSFAKPFMLYAEAARPAASLTRPVAQPARAQRSCASRPAGRRDIPESVRLLFGEH